MLLNIVMETVVLERWAFVFLETGSPIIQGSLKFIL